jgi:multidrug transporter EmrE-like cation transporter
LASVTTLAPPAVDIHLARRRRRSLIIVICCTLIGAAAQVLLKFGASHLLHPTLLQAAVGIFTNPYLFCGYALYGVFAALLVLALRHGELSLLYPVIALNYAWVSILSVVIFHEQMNPMKIAGVTVIIIGVAVLGRGGTKA